MKLKYVILLFMFVTFQNLKAENPDSNKINDFYLNLGLGLTSTAISPEYNTSLPYFGVNGNLFFSTIHYLNKFYIAVNENIAAGILNSYKTPNNHTLSQNNIHNNFSINCLYNSYNFKKPAIKLYTGLQVSNMVSVRIKQSAVANSAFSYLASFSVDISLMAEYRFSLESFCKKSCKLKNYALNLSLSNPIWAIVYFPPYIGQPENLVNQDAGMVDFSSNYQSVFTKYVNLQTGLEFKYFIQNGNVFSIKYSRAFISSKSDLSTIKMLNNSLLFSLLVNLN